MQAIYDLDFQMTSGAVAQAEPETPTRDTDVSFMRGLFYGVVFSLAGWAAIAGLIVALL